MLIYANVIMIYPVMCYLKAAGNRHVPPHLCDDLSEQGELCLEWVYSAHVLTVSNIVLVVVRCVVGYCFESKIQKRANITFWGRKWIHVV